MLTKADLLAVKIGLGGACTPEDCTAVAEEVLRTIIEKTASPRTCEEITRVLDER